MVYHSVVLYSLVCFVNNAQLRKVLSGLRRSRGAAPQVIRFYGNVHHCPYACDVVGDLFCCVPLSKGLYYEKCVFRALVCMKRVARFPDRRPMNRSGG